MAHIVENNGIAPPPPWGRPVVGFGVKNQSRPALVGTSAHDWHLKAKELETQLQSAKANEEWARSIVAHCVTRTAPPPQGSGSQGSGSQLGKSVRLPSRWPASKAAMTTPIQPRPCSFVLRVGVPQGAHLGCTSAQCAVWGYRGTQAREGLALCALMGCSVLGRGTTCGTPPILGVVNMVGTRNFTCYMGAL